jgi:hypothetical protein
MFKKVNEIKKKLHDENDVTSLNSLNLQNCQKAQQRRLFQKYFDLVKL